jgi:hypothetical protein
MVDIDIIGYTNHGQLPLAKNWLASMDRLGILDRATLYCVGSRACDELADFAVRHRLNFSLQLFKPSIQQVDEQADWGQPAFVRVVLGRLELLIDLCGVEPFRPFVQVDMDCAFVTNPLPYLESLDNSDMWVQSNRQDLARPEEYEFCNGIAYYRTPQLAMLQRALHWLTEKLPEIGRGQYADDERAINVSCHCCHVRRSALAITSFPTGQVSWSVSPRIVHANWVIGLVPKIEKLRAAGYWYLDELEGTSCT